MSQQTSNEFFESQTYTKQIFKSTHTNCRDEVYLQTLVSNRGLSPRIIGSEVTCESSFVEMEKIDGVNLAQIANCLGDDIERISIFIDVFTPLLQQTLKDLFEIVEGWNPYPDNIMIDVNLKIWVLDFQNCRQNIAYSANFSTVERARDELLANLYEQNGTETNFDVCNSIINGIISSADKKIIEESLELVDEIQTKITELEENALVSDELNDSQQKVNEDILDEILTKFEKLNDVLENEDEEENDTKQSANSIVQDDL